MVGGAPPSPPPKPHRAHVLSEATRLIVTERNNTYGNPHDDFTRTADMWNAVFGEKLACGRSFKASDVARALICVKLSRSSHAATMDNWIDIAGYAACASECEELGD